jgi:hypothetical protein
MLPVVRMHCVALEAVIVGGFLGEGEEDGVVWKAGGVPLCLSDELRSDGCL